MKNQSIYQKTILSILKKLGLKDYDPRHIEGYMRLQYSTLDHLSNYEFENEVKTCVQCINHGGPVLAEKTAQSYGL